jgi:hypothetical protein
MSINFIKSLKFVNHKFLLELRVLLKKMDLFKNWKERQDLCYNIGFFNLNMLVKGKLQWLWKEWSKEFFYHVEDNHHQKNEIAYTSTCKDNVVQQLNIAHAEEENTKWIPSIPTWGVGVLKCFKILSLRLN